jgi:hypothetical protein
MDSYQSVLRSGLAKIREAHDMAATFEHVDHFIVHYNLGDGSEKQWQSEAFLNGRFMITLSVNVELSESLDEIVSVTGTPSFRIIEYVSIEKLTDGRFQAKAGRQREFGLDLWSKFLENRDLNLFHEGWSLSTPVENFEELAKEISSNRISLLAE